MKLKTKYCILIIAVLCIIFFSDVFSHPTNVFVGRDNKDVFLYNYNYVHDSFQNYGQFPLWDINKYSGTFPDINTPRFYPLSFISLFFFKDFFVNYVYALSIFLAGLFMYFFSHSLKLREFPSLVSAIIFMFSGRVITLVGGSASQIIAVSLIPLVFWMFNLLYEKRKILYSVLLGLSLGLQFLAGEPQYFYITCLGLGLYFLYTTFTLRKKGKEAGKFLGLFLFSIIIGICLAAIYFIPSLESTSYLNRLGGNNVLRGADFDYVTSSGSLPIPQLITAVMPFSFGNAWKGVYWGAPEAGELYFYLGLFPLILALIALIFMRKNKYTIFFSILAAFSLFFAFGKNTPFFYLMYKLVPGVSLFRIPSKILALYSLSVAILAGMGASYLCYDINNKIKRKVAEIKKLNILPSLLFTLSLLSTAFLMIIYFFKSSILSLGESFLYKMYYDTYAGSIFVQTHSFESLLGMINNAYSLLVNSVLAFTIILFLASLLFYSGIKNKIPIKTFKIILIIFIFADVAFYGISIHSASFGNQDKLVDNPEILKAIKQDNSLYRVLVTDQNIFSQYASEKYGIQQFLGVGSSRLNHFDEFLKDGVNIVNPAYSKIRWGTLIVPANMTNHSYSSKLLGMMNVKYIVGNEELNNNDYELKNTINNTYIYENKKVLPRAFVVGNADIIDSKETIFSNMKSNDFEPFEKIILEKPINKPLSNNISFKEANISFYSPNKIKINADMDENGFLVLSDVWYPGWKAYDNGKETEIYKTDYVIRSIYIEKGSHQVEFVFYPYLFKTGMIITITTFLLLIIYFLIYLVIKKNK